jgi:hypothetical protein
MRLCPDERGGRVGQCSVECTHFMHTSCTPDRPCLAHRIGSRRIAQVTNKVVSCKRLKSCGGETLLGRRRDSRGRTSGDEALAFVLRGRCTRVARYGSDLDRLHVHQGSSERATTEATQIPFSAVSYSPSSVPVCNRTFTVPEPRSHHRSPVCGSDFTM